MIQHAAILKDIVDQEKGITAVNNEESQSGEITFGKVEEKDE